jgi:hypothetical protein
MMAQAQQSPCPLPLLRPPVPLPTHQSPASTACAACVPACLQIEYIFSDKTGTLTSNEMQLRQIAVKGVAYGNPDVRLEENMDKTGLPGLKLFDARLYKAAAKVQRSASWTGLITAGGSRRDVMAHPTSYPNLDSADSLGINEGPEEGTPQQAGVSGGRGACTMPCGRRASRQAGRQAGTL